MRPHLLGLRRHRRAPAKPGLVVNAEAEEAKLGAVITWTTEMIWIEALDA